MQTSQTTLAAPPTAHVIGPNGTRALPYCLAPCSRSICVSQGCDRRCQTIVYREKRSHPHPYVPFRLLFFFIIIYTLRAAIGEFQTVLEIIRKSADITLYKKWSCNLLAQAPPGRRSTPTGRVFLSCSDGTSEWGTRRMTGNLKAREPHRCGATVCRQHFFSAPNQERNMDVRIACNISLAFI